ncbi:MAG: hypothetical protein KGM46_10810 [Pseudomonadota bacterium]|nr:hypothetical protein [Xanthomonadaceae bacterium]MDE2247390.1 hypothetical protein [Xanthomonadaceae bacterium]MDE3211221.1 hypothetical protein [Pseudomonadota bacterium]
MNRNPHDPATRLLTPRTLVLFAMIGFAAGYRLVVHFLPGLLPWNFTPVEAMALFGGAYFADRRWAILAPLAAMAVADGVIALSLPAAQVRDWVTIAPIIYACIALTAFAGFALRGRARPLNIAIAAGASATGFFVVTNFFVWLGSGMYAASLSGLTACYVAGLPFYQYGSLPGTLLWSAILFGGFALLSRRYTMLAAAPATA